jgi:hypothetical protein
MAALAKLWAAKAISDKFDGFGRLTETTSTMGGFSRKIGHAFDRDGRRVETTWSDAARAWFTRDELGRIKMGYQGALADTSTPMVAFAYNSSGLLYYFTRKGGDCTQYSYDVALRLSSLYHCFGGGTGNVNSTFAYNPASQLSQEVRDNDAMPTRPSSPPGPSPPTASTATPRSRARRSATTPTATSPPRAR